MKNFIYIVRAVPYLCQVIRMRFGTDLLFHLDHGDLFLQLAPFAISVVNDIDVFVAVRATLQPVAVRKNRASEKILLSSVFMA